MVRAGRPLRLTGPDAFVGVFRRGNSREGEYLQLVAAPAARECGRAGFVIGRKALPRAVDRNRIRRMLRVTLCGARPAIDGHDVILRLKRGAPRAEFPRIVAEAARLLSAIAAAAPDHRGQRMSPGNGTQTGDEGGQRMKPDNG